MALSNKELKKRLKDALADQEGTVTEKIASAAAISDPQEQKLLKDALADQAGLVTEKLSVAIGNDISPEVEGAAATFTGQVDGMTEDVTLDASTEGEAGNDILLEFDGILDIDGAILAWNTANPSNEVELSDGDGSQIPDDGTSIQLAGGVTAVAAVVSELTAADQKLLQDALADQGGELTAAIASGENFNS